MDMESRNQYLRVLRERYLKARTKKEKAQILDEYCHRDRLEFTRSRPGRKNDNAYLSHYAPSEREASVSAVMFVLPIYFE